MNWNLAFFVVIFTIPFACLTLWVLYKVFIEKNPRKSGAIKKGDNALQKKTGIVNMIKEISCPKTTLSSATKKIAAAEPKAVVHILQKWLDEENKK